MAGCQECGGQSESGPGVRDNYVASRTYESSPPVGVPGPMGPPRLGGEGMIAAIYARKIHRPRRRRRRGEVRHAANRRRARVHRVEGLDARRTPRLHRRRCQGALFANRAEFQRMMRDAAGGAFEAVVFYRPRPLRSQRPTRRWWRSTRWRTSASPSGTTAPAQPCRPRLVRGAR